MGGAAVIGGIVGSMVAPEDESTTAHGAMWAGISAATAGAASLVILDSDKDAKEKQRQIDSLHKEIGVLRGEDDYSPSEKEMISTQPSLEKGLPTEYQHLVKPGKWSIYKIDQWISGGENEMVHQDKMIKLEPAQINVGSN